MPANDILRHISKIRRLLNAPFRMRHAAVGFRERRWDDGKRPLPTCRSHRAR